MGTSSLRFFFLEVPQCISTGVFSIDKLQDPNDPKIECIVTFLVGPPNSRILKLNCQELSISNEMEMNLSKVNNKS